MLPGQAGLAQTNRVLSDWGPVGCSDATSWQQAEVVVYRPAFVNAGRLRCIDNERADDHETLEHDSTVKRQPRSAGSVSASSGVVRCATSQQVGPTLECRFPFNSGTGRCTCLALCRQHLPRHPRQPLVTSMRVVRMTAVDAGMSHVGGMIDIQTLGPMLSLSVHLLSG